MKYTNSIAMAAIMLAAVFAGVALVADDADAADSYTITYEGENGIITQPVTGTTATLKSTEEVKNILNFNKDMYKLVGWKTAGDVPQVYRYMITEAPRKYRGEW